MLPTVKTPPSISSVPHSIRQEDPELLLMFTMPPVMLSVPAVTIMSSSIFMVSPSNVNVFVPELMSIEPQVMSPVEVTEPPVVSVLIVMFSLFTQLKACDPLLLYVMFEQ